jgi:hypothetical protein
MRAMVDSTNHRVTRRAVRRKKATTNLANITITSARREAAKKDHIILTTPDTNTKMDMKNITRTKRNTERKVCDCEEQKIIFYSFQTFFLVGGSEHSKKWGHKKSSKKGGH